MKLSSTKKYPAILLSLCLLLLGLAVGPTALRAQSNPGQPATTTTSGDERQGETVARDEGRAAQLASEISHEIYSPFCPGKTLAMCPSSAAAEVRQDIQKMASKGMEKQEIKETVIQTYGEEFRFTEPPAGDNLGLLIALAFGLLGAVLVIFMFSRRGRAEPRHDLPADNDDAPPEDGQTGDPYLDSLRQEYRD